MCIFKLRSCCFVMCSFIYFFSCNFLLSARPFSLCWYKAFLTVDNNNILLLQSASLQDHSLLLWGSFRLFTPKHIHVKLFPHWAVGCVPIAVMHARYCLNRWTQDLEASAYSTLEWARVEVAHKCLLYTLVDCSFIYPRCYAKKPPIVWAELYLRVQVCFCLTLQMLVIIPTA